MESERDGGRERGADVNAESVCFTERKST